METYKLIRKICLWITAIWGVGVAVFVAYENYEFCRKGCGTNPWDDFGLLVLFLIGLYIGVYVLFEIVSKIIQAVKKDTGKMKVFSDKQYLEAYSEVEENNIQNKELWAKAFAQCGGDKEKQKSIYVELRTKELSKG
jgi:hypothetical protein